MKTSCRSCGSSLVPSSYCPDCKECILWICSVCEKIEDVTHAHNYLTATV